MKSTPKNEPTDVYEQMSVAIKARDVVRLDALIDVCPDIERPVNFSGYKPLMLAASLASLECARRLIERGASPHPAVLPAVKSGNKACVRLMLESGGDPNGCPKSGYLSPLSLAITLEHIDLVALLIDQGADVNAQESDGWAPILRAVALKSDSGVVIAKLLLAAGASPDYAPGMPWAPLVHAARNQNTAQAFLLAEYGADLSIIEGAYPEIHQALVAKRAADTLKSGVKTRARDGLSL